MTISILKLALDAAAETSERNGGAIQDIVTELRCYGSWDDETIFNKWKKIQDELNLSYIGLTILDAGDQEIILNEVLYNDIYGQAFSVILRKNFPNNVAFFMSIDGFSKGIRSESLQKNIHTVFILYEFEEFSSRSCRFLPLRGDTDLLDLEHSINPMYFEDVQSGKLTRYLTRTRNPPMLGFWLQKSAPQDNSPVWQAWATAAAENLMYVPANEIWEDQSGIRITITGPKHGPRKRNLKEGLEKLDALKAFPVLNAAVTWIVEVPREASVRHVYLTAELAREWPVNSEAWGEHLSHCLDTSMEGAKAHYEAHLLETSSDMLKALADLRKAVNEETSKSVDKTHALLTTLAGSLAAGLGVILFRLPYLTNLSHSVNEIIISQILFAALSAWMLFVCAFSMMVNFKFRRALNISRNNWHSKIHAILPTDDFEKMAAQPLRHAEYIYNCASIFISVIYITAALILAFLAWCPWILMK